MEPLQIFKALPVSQGPGLIMSRSQVFFQGRIFQFISKLPGTSASGGVGPEWMTVWCLCYLPERNCKVHDEPPILTTTPQILSWNPTCLFHLIFNYMLCHHTPKDGHSMPDFTSSIGKCHHFFTSALPGFCAKGLLKTLFRQSCLILPLDKMTQPHFYLQTQNTLRTFMKLFKNFYKLLFAEGTACNHPPNHMRRA